VRHVKDQQITVKVTFQVFPADAESKSCTISGTGKDLGLTFSKTEDLKGGSQVVEFTSNEKLPNVLRLLKGDIQWSVNNGVDPAFASTELLSWGHEIFVTVDIPMDSAAAARQEDGVTTKRMRRALEWVDPAKTISPHRVVAEMRKQFTFYALRPNPAVPTEHDHPKFQSNTTGGAWPLADYAQYSGECQAQVRLIRAMLRQLGVPGKADIFVVWAEPQNPDQALEADWEIYPNAGLGAANPNAQRTSPKGARQFAVLFDSKVGTDWTYAGNHRKLPNGDTGPGANRYEACLRFEAEGTTKFYGGGSGVFANKDETLRTFWGLAWVEFLDDSDDPPFHVIEVIKIYR
jgi:hypothetical protein